MPPLFRPAILRCTWLSACPTGIDTVDAEHHRLLRRLEGVQEAACAREDGACRAQLEEFADSLIAHFQSEERLLSRLDASRAAHHARDHRELAVRVDRIRRAAAAAKPTRSLAAHVDALTAVLVSEIAALDCDFRSPDLAPLSFAG